MNKYSALVEQAVAAIAAHGEQKNLGNLFAGRGAKLLDESHLGKSTKDFELVTWLVIADGAA